ncbi:hypothetical protein AAAA53_23915 [Escherichia coli]|uniref:hypothetical protein n=1 Tax=Escherichia coli TaxID=562 RepID=UPI0034D96308
MNWPKGSSISKRGSKDYHHRQYATVPAKAGAVLIFWHELAINGYASMNAIKRQELIDADFQRLRNLIWPEDDR